MERDVPERITGKDGGSEEAREIATQEARAHATRLLARREHSRRELRTKLAARGYEARAIDAALAELASRGLQSDARFVEGFVRSALARGQGELKIRAALRQRGIDDNLASPHLALDDAQWGERAAKALRKRFGAAPPCDCAERAHQVRFLAGRGFPSAVALRAIAARPASPVL